MSLARALPARVAPGLDAHQQAMLEVGVGLGQEAFGDGVGHFRPDQTVPEGHIVLANDVTRPAARVRAGMSHGHAAAVDDADLPVLGIGIVLHKLLQHRSRGETLRQQT